MTLRLEPGPRDDDNRWPCCDHCDHEWRSEWTVGHDEPCFGCGQETP